MKHLFVCGPSGKALTKADRKTVKKFQQFLRGDPRDRCPLCLHRADTHTTRCKPGCGCSLTFCQVKAFWVSRRAKA